MLSETVDSAIGVALGAHKAAESNSGELASELTIGIEMANVQLDGSMVASADEAVGGRASENPIDISLCLNKRKIPRERPTTCGECKDQPSCLLRFPFDNIFLRKRKIVTFRE